MANAHRILLAAALIAATLSLGACIPLVVAGAAGAALVVSDRRSTSTQIDDAAIETKLAGTLAERHGERAHVNVTSYNGVVLLTGEVPDVAAKVGVAAMAQATDRVRSVHDELVVAPPAELSGRTNDAYLTSLVKSRFLEATDTFSTTHVKVVTERSVVYLMGLVRRAEADAATRIAASTHGVSRVVKVFEYLD
jgi:osmotically-inducible protein OsmY